MKPRRFIEWFRALRDNRPNLPALISLLLIPVREETAPRTTWHSRMHTCVRCPMYRPAQKTCGLCGCYLPFKAAFRDQECPNQYENEPSIRKWKA